MFVTLGALAVSIALPVAFAAGTALAAGRELLSGAAMGGDSHCTTLTIRFGLQVQYLSHYPLGEGDKLRVLLQPIDGTPAASGSETIPVPAAGAAEISAIGLERDEASAAVNITFSHTLAYKVRAAADFRGLVITLPGRDPEARCKPEVTGAADSSRLIKVAIGEPASVGSDRVRDMAAAHVALTTGRYEDAIRLLTKILEQPKGPFGKEGRELLGLARQRNNQFAQAEAEYRQYLNDFPGGADAARVQQRLDGVIALENKPFEDQHQAVDERQRQADQAAITQARAASLVAAEQTRSQAQVRPVPPSGPLRPADLTGPVVGASAPIATGWQRSYDGSIGVYYLRNQSSADILDPITPGATTRQSVVFQDTTTTEIDLRGTISNGAFAASAEFSGSQDKSFNAGQIDYARLSHANLEANWKTVGLDVKAGRQTRYGGGVLGRFDGVLVSYDLSPTRRIDVVAGAPVDLTSDGFMLRNRLFYGVSYDFALWDPKWTASVFGIQQLADGALDRRAVGYDLRYTSSNFALYNTFDYDMNFAQPNAFILAGSYSFADRSQLGLDLDYRKSPSLFASNAIQGQGADRLGSLLGRYDYSQIAQYAVDRSADTFSASLNYNRTLNGHLSVYGNLYESYFGPTAASGGVDAVPAEGPDTYVTAQLIANGLVRESDLYVAGVNLAHTSSSNGCEVGFGAKFPVTDKLRVSPESKFGYKTFNTDGHTEFHFLPSLGFNYLFTRSSSLELDAGGHMTERFGQPTVPGGPRDWELLLTAGYRYDFNSQ